MREGRVVAATSDGRLTGDERSIEALRNAGYVSRAIAMTPEAASARVSIVERLLGWAALAVMMAALLRRATPR